MDIGDGSFSHFLTSHDIAAIAIMTEHEQDSKTNHKGCDTPVHVAIAYHTGDDAQDEDARAGTDIEHIIEGRAGGTAPFRADHIQDPRQQGREQQAGT